MDNDTTKQQTKQPKSIGAALPAGGVTNPVVRNCPDPGIFRAGATYYVMGTNPTMGFNVWSSKDLATWKPLGLALRPSPAAGSRGYWAPEVTVTRNGKPAWDSPHGLCNQTNGLQGCVYWLFYTVEYPKARIMVARATRPEGPYTPHAHLKGADGHIDSHVTYHRGKWYMFAARVDGVHVFDLAPDFKSVSNRTHCFGFRTHPDAWTNSPVNEAPVVLHAKDGGLVMTYSANSAKGGYSLACATAPSPRGPWKKTAAKNPVLTGGKGHCSYVDTAGGLVVAYHKSMPGGGADGRSTCVAKARLVEDAVVIDRRPGGGDD